MSVDPDDHELYVVRVSDVLVPALLGDAGCRYESAPQCESEARLLVLVLLSSKRTPVGEGPWLRPLAGGRCQVVLCRVHRE
jgi:hypothetical protein